MALARARAEARDERRYQGGTVKELKPSDFLNLFEYEKRRPEIRAEIMEAKRTRRFPVNPFLTLLFENRQTVWYQIQEMARAERMTEEEQFLEEIEAYSPLLPGSNQWKATLYIEIPDEKRLKEMLPQLPGIEHSFYARIGEDKVKALGEEGRSREDYTSTVHYLTWTLTDAYLRRLGRGEPLFFGTDLPYCPCEAQVPGALRDQLMKDLKGED
jgi:hypothetical protein